MASAVALRVSDLHFGPARGQPGGRFEKHFARQYNSDKENFPEPQVNGRWNSRRSLKLEPRWEPFYCVLLQDVCTFTHYPTEEMSIGDRLFVDLPRVRLDGGRQAFRRRWGYEVSAPPPLLEEDEDSDLSETTSLRDERLLRFSPIGRQFSPIQTNRNRSSLTIGWRGEWWVT
ncbi:uncharacterized protein LOC111088496 [Limulus polyphemus]|uniref:Uncharacterized protein LOC111088496 n=1 Tax=Limulus polyphemus TaxID=6850 RepID=A0ABM1TF50_LIMPO|nr:uncharacterized protein LOC111088496 [Limulus polyphemus]